MLRVCAAVSVAASVVRENFGILHMSQRQWTAAYNEFFAAFRSYSEAGNAAAKKCLKSGAVLHTDNCAHPRAYTQAHSRTPTVV